MTKATFPKAQDGAGRTSAVRARSSEKAERTAEGLKFDRPRQRPIHLIKSCKDHFSLLHMDSGQIRVIRPNKADRLADLGLGIGQGGLRLANPVPANGITFRI